MDVYSNHAKRRLASGKLTIGMVLHQARTVNIAAIAKTCGFDFFSVDMEHGSFAIDTAAQIVNAALPLGITSLVRVPATDHDAARLLDAGAQGIIVPHVETSEAAARAVWQCKFPPLGDRSDAVLPHLSFRIPSAPELAERVNEETLVVVMVESRKGVENAEAIAAVPGIDVILIGTNDLCRDLGIPDQFLDPRLEQAYRSVIAACQRHGVAPGMTGLHVPDLSRKFVELGMRFVMGGTDLNFLMTAARERAQFLRSLLAD